MRLIDADILITKIAYVAKHCARSDAQKALAGRIFYIIENMPTIAEENKHDKRHGQAAPADTERA